MARKQSHAVLRASRNGFAAIADSAPVMIWMCGAGQTMHPGLQPRWLEATTP
jgi:hypothetical protein